MSRNEHDAHTALRAGRIDTGARAPIRKAARWHAGHAVAAAVVVTALVVASQHVDAIVALVRGVIA